MILGAVPDTVGWVREARVLRSVPLPDVGTLEVMQQWQFTPTRLNGEPVPVVTSVAVVFSLR